MANLGKKLLSKDITYPKPLEGERPTSYADRVGIWCARHKSANHRKAFGFYLTPIQIAAFMADLITAKGKFLNILDPGAGAGILSCAAVESLVYRKEKPEEISLVVYEFDSELITPLNDTLGYLKLWAKKNNVFVKVKVVEKDFILEHAQALTLMGGLFSYPSAEKNFDIVISNPPYFKLQKADLRTKAASTVVHGQPNIYALFMAVGAALLNQNGTFVYITPRSFVSGQYFRQFREKFFSFIRPEQVHAFESRKEVFSRDEVLQENIIIKATRDDNWSQSTAGHILLITSSKGITDIDSAKRLTVPLDEMLDMKSKNKILRLPTSKEAQAVLRLIDAWPMSLEKIKMKISTGRVVPFRVKKYLDEVGEVPATHAPLLWMQNVRPMALKWPNGNRKPQYIRGNARDRSLLVPCRNYVLLRRFSAKGDSQRLIAAPFIVENFKYPYLGIENHLNYIHRPGDTLSEDEAWGLAALLNSNLFDIYFGSINGNTQVSATELRDLPLPEHEVIIALGNIIKHQKDPLINLNKYVLKFVKRFDDGILKTMETARLG